MRAFVAVSADAEPGRGEEDKHDEGGEAADGVHLAGAGVSPTAADAVHSSIGLDGSMARSRCPSPAQRRRHRSARVRVLRRARRSWRTARTRRSRAGRSSRAPTARPTRAPTSHASRTGWRPAPAPRSRSSTQATAGCSARPGSWRSTGRAPARRSATGSPPGARPRCRLARRAAPRRVVVRDARARAPGAAHRAPQRRLAARWPARDRLRAASPRRSCSAPRGRSLHRRRLLRALPAAGG